MAPQILQSMRTPNGPYETVSNVDTHARLRKGQQRDGRRITDPLPAKRSGLPIAIGSDRSGRIAQRTWKRADAHSINRSSDAKREQLVDWHVRVLRVAKFKSHICDYDKGSDGDCQSLSSSSWTLTWLIFGANMWCERMRFIFLLFYRILILICYVWSTKLRIYIPIYRENTYTTKNVHIGTFHSNIIMLIHPSLLVCRIRFSCTN